MSGILPRSFYARDALEVATDLVGALLVHGGVTLRITEVEAYRKGGDTANHCTAGRTPRNAAMWGPPGHAYVYICYGMHAMLNLVTDADGVGAAVLVRSAELVTGHAVVFERRLRPRVHARSARSPDELSPAALAALLAGPGKVAQALGLTLAHNHHPLFSAGGLEVREGERPDRLLAGPRVGIDYAAEEHRLAPWRIADASSRAVSVRSTLTPLEPPRGRRSGAGRARR